MQRQRGELAPAAFTRPDLPERSTDPGHIQALRRNSRTFTLADQVNRLVGASETTPDRGFLGRTMALCSLPRSNPGNRHQYKRVNGPYKLIMIAGGDNKLPFGNLPRLLLAWLSTEAVRTQSRELVLGRSLSDFMRTLGVYSSAGGVQTRLRNQMNRLFSRCTVSSEWTRAEASDNQTVQDFPVQADESGPLPKLGHECHSHLEHRLHERRHRTAAGRGEDRPRHRSRPSVACPLRARQSLR